MKRMFGTALAMVIASSFPISIRAEGAKDVDAILDRAVEALGGAEKLGKMKVAKWHSKGTITLGGNENPITSDTTVDGVSRLRVDFEGEFGGNKVKGVRVLNGEKAWQKFGEQSSELEGEGLAGMKRTGYLTVIPMTILPLKDKAFKVQALGEEKVGDKAAVGVKATGPDGKEFSLYFDKTNGLPVKLIAKNADPQGNEFLQETMFTDYKEMGGFKRPGKIRANRDGEKYLEVDVSDFKVVEKADPKAFAEPE